MTWYIGGLCLALGVVVAHRSADGPIPGKHIELLEPCRNGVALRGFFYAGSGTEHHNRSEKMEIVDQVGEFAHNLYSADRAVPGYESGAAAVAGQTIQCLAPEIMSQSNATG